MRKCLMLLLLVLGAADIQAQSDTLSLTGPRQVSPTGAMLRSAILPGWGQVYTESYLKAPLLFGTFATFGGIALWYHNRYLDYQGYTRQAFESPDGELNGRSAELLRLYREFYRDERDRYLFYVFLTYLLNIADAYVDAHLYGFDVDGSLAIRPPAWPGPATPSAYSLQISITF